MSEEYASKLTYKRLALAELIKPSEGAEVMLDRYWLCTSDDHVLIYGRCSPQCNKRLALVQRMVKRASDAIGDGLHVVHVKAAFVPPHMLDHE